MLRAPSIALQLDIKDMFDKKTLYQFWTRLRPLKISYFSIAFAIVLAACALALRANNEQMVRLRQQVYTADKNNGDIEGALKQLQAYVTAHMNTNLSAGNGSVYPPIQLKYTYERLQQAELDQISQANGALYTQAQHYCEQQDSTDFSGHNRVPCIESYVTSHGVQPKTIPAGLYKFDFISPTWSPDLAGWLVVLAVFMGLLLAVRVVLGFWLKRVVW